MSDTDTGKWQTVKRTTKPKSPNTGNRPFTPTYTKDDGSTFLKRKPEQMKLKKDTPRPAHYDDLATHQLKIDAETETFKHKTLSDAKPEVPQRMKDYRRTHNLTQAQLAQKLNLPTTTIRDYEAGQVIPNPHIVQKINSFCNEVL